MSKSFSKSKIELNRRQWIKEQMDWTLKRYPTPAHTKSSVDTIWLSWAKERLTRVEPYDKPILHPVRKARRLQKLKMNIDALL